ncbi:MAG: hypothetical protein J6S21_06480, partial [Victivallales bacterium]|nr:hypothetical protein [Victivallales bacterium]
MQQISLNGAWQLAFTMPDGTQMDIPAQVPGNVELDLARAGLVGNTIPVDCEYPERWVESIDWCYHRTFTMDEMPADGQEVLLRFGGIDTVADVLLNGILLGHCENMFVPQIFDASRALKAGENTVEVRITAPEIAARRHPLPPRTASNTSGASIYMRKARHHWGWDNAPRRLTSGLWREVTLEFPPAIRFTDVYAYTEKVDTAAGEAEIGCTFSFTTPERSLEGYQVLLKLEKDGRTVLEKRRNILFTSVFMRELKVTGVKFWWPAGYGDPELYDFSLTLYRNGEAVAEHRHQMGIRRFLLDRTETTTPEGSGEFQLYCNNVKIYIRGTNWKPLSPFPSETPAKLERALALLEECNCNLVRVWGGGVYEDREFFQWCDRRGMMIWQDFMLACEFPPSDDFYLEAVRREAETVVKSFRNHPSLALWCGDNECDDIITWGNLSQRNLLPSMNRITRQVLPQVIADLDPARDFLPSSPYLADEILTVKRTCDDPVNILNNAPEQHVYCKEITKGGFREYFRRSAAHLISETGPFYINAISETPEILALEMPRMKRLWNMPEEKVGGDSGGNHQSDLYCATWIK